jgi:TfoX/Sxy family transcriptional regulator of competence genes
MPYNVELEDRIDRLVLRLGDLDKKKMFGGVGYMLDGNMCFGIHKESLVLRVSPEQAGRLMQDDSFTVFDITGRPMKGWLLAAPDAVETDEQLLELLTLGADFAKTLKKK